jgi:hypothetical protein
MYDYIIYQLQQNADVFNSLLQNIVEDEYKWKPEPAKWCLLEVVCHLHDEEREDFRSRLKHVLDDNNEPMPAIDPQGWVTSRNYMDKDYQTVLNMFLVERRQSVQWLRSLENPQWNNTYEHPKLGTMDGNLFLSNWLAHDYLHIRQITRLKYEYLQHLSQQNLGYAGNW